MLLRKIQPNLKYAVGELLIVTVGVLIAIGIDRWNTIRLNRNEELVVINQLAADMRTDVRKIENAINLLAEKEVSLRRLQAAFEKSAAESDDIQVLNDVIVGAIFGWSQGIAERSSFDELLGSGEFSLIQSAGLRRQISGYYTQWSEYNRMSDERETSFPALSYRLVPRQRSATSVNGPIGMLQFDSDTTPEKARELVESIFESELTVHVIAELNLARFVQGMMFDVSADATELLQNLDEYKGTATQ